MKRRPVPKKVIYADQIARQRKFDSAVLEALTKGVSPSKTLVSVVLENLRARKKYSHDNGRSLVRWMAQCGASLCSFDFDEALESIEHCSSEKLQAMANVLQVGT